MHNNNNVKIWRGEQLSEALGVQLNPNIFAQKVEFNSKDVKEGDIFIAIKGNGDGHDYIKDALEHGASLVIASKPVANIPKSKIILVADTLAALYKLAEYKRKKSLAKFIGVTGSVGKTTTKEIINNMLGCFGKTFVSRSNFNNYLGLPLNLASMPDDIEYAVIEMGMNHTGELRELTRIAKPDIAIITAVAEAHLAFFNSVAAIAEAKCEIFEGVPKDGVAIINRDSDYYDRMANKAGKIKLCSFGLHPDASGRLISYKILGENVQLNYLINSSKVEVNLPFVPEHYALNIAAGLMTVSVLGLDPRLATKNLAAVGMLEGRGKIINVSKNGKNYRLISDYYNANPASLRAALKYLTQLDSSEKIAIIGDMLELGDSSAELHKALVPFILDSGINQIFLVGSLVQNIQPLLPPTIATYHFANVDLLIANLDDLLKGDELILIKGSKSMQLYKIINFLQKL